MIAALAAAACATTQYPPLATNPDVLSLRYDDGVQVVSGDGKPVAGAPMFTGLTDFVGCHKEARVEAKAAESTGTAARVTGVLALVLAAGASVGWASLADRDHLAPLLITGMSSALVGLGLGMANLWLRHQATGHAMDAVSLHNDQVLNGGGGCFAGSP
jgi:hypothetical protein